MRLFQLNVRSQTKRSLSGTIRMLTIKSPESHLTSPRFLNLNINLDLAVDVGVNVGVNVSFSQTAQAPSQHTKTPTYLTSGLGPRRNVYMNLGSNRSPNAMTKGLLMNKRGTYTRSSTTQTPPTNSVTRIRPSGIVKRGLGLSLSLRGMTTELLLSTRLLRPLRVPNQDGELRALTLGQSGCIEGRLVNATDFFPMRHDFTTGAFCLLFLRTGLYA
ncbi:MAG: hypothetical protein M1828_005296 [Chrysothrix sp. TS-e1954]|nr:MAG: hypothetical protein M1828_005296 [Chrysothrix sp. TS-e1954]